MVDPIHDDEPDVGEAVVRALLGAECPQWSARPVEYLATSGTDNAMWRVHLDQGPDLVVRLPRRPHAAANVNHEVEVLAGIEGSPVAALVKTPAVRHRGRPHEVFPHPWSVLEWIEGMDAWTARHHLAGADLGPLATDLGRLVDALARTTGVDARPRPPGDRGGPLAPLLDRLDRWLSDPAGNAESLIDVAGVRRLADQARELVDEPVATGLVHGDLIPGNLLVADRRLTAVLDWGSAGHGDPAQDLAPAWSVLPAGAREVFRRAVGDVGEAAWIRGRAFELEHAVGAVLYYRPRRHPLGEVMARTLDRILDET